MHRSPGTWGRRAHRLHEHGLRRRGPRHRRGTGHGRGDYPERSLRTLRPGGILVSITGLGSAARLRAEAQTLGVRAAVLLVEPDRTALERLAQLVEKGQLRPHVAGVFPLAEAARAHELGETNHTAGRIVLTVA